MVVLCACASQILTREPFDMRPDAAITSGSRRTQAAAFFLNAIG
jgi:hypothetical protein